MDDIDISSPPDFEVAPVDTYLDVMPDEDGFELLRRIRAHEAASGWEPAPAIAVTAYAAIADREQALKAGFADHIPKPVLPEVLTLAILQATERRRL